MRNKLSLSQLLDRTRGRFDDEYRGPDEDYTDAIMATASYSIPDYTSDLLSVAMDNFWLAEVKSENGASNAVDCISENVYTMLVEDLESYLLDLSVEWYAKALECVHCGSLFDPEKSLAQSDHDFCDSTCENEYNAELIDLVQDLTEQL